MKGHHFFPSRPVHASGFTLLELLVVIAIIGILAAIIMPVFARTKHVAKRAQCINNLRQFAAADLAYFNDNGELPAIEGIIPSTISAQRLTNMAKYINMPVPTGPVTKWPKRMQQPEWFNCPMARDSGYAEGLTAGGGVYIGYMYVGGIADSQLILAGIATLTNPEHSASRKNLNRGVLWCDILSEFRTSDPRRYECFHAERGKRYPDFRFPEKELEGIHRAWSDGSVEWVPTSQLKLSEANSPSLQIRHFLGNYYY